MKRYKICFEIKLNGIAEAKLFAEKVEDRYSSVFDITLLKIEELGKKQE